MSRGPHKVKPRVYYLNLPKKFIAGTVYDPVEEEVVIGAAVTLRPAGGKAGKAGAPQTIKTDAYGDFWFEGLADGVYEVEIASGKKSKVFKDLDTAVADINLGDIALT